MAEKKKELLMKNHQSRRTSFIPFPKANGTSYNGNKGNHSHGRGRKKKL